MTNKAEQKCLPMMLLLFAKWLYFGSFKASIPERTLAATRCVRKPRDMIVNAAEPADIHQARAPYGSHSSTRASSAVD